MDWTTLFGVAVVAILGAIATGYTRYLSSSENKANRIRLDEFSLKLLEVEMSERQCQEERKQDSAKHLALFQENAFLREVLPQKMVDGVETLVEHAVRQTEKLEAIDAKAENLKKLEKWDSDPGGAVKRNFEELKQLALAQGHKIADIEMVLAQMALRREKEKLD